MKNLKIIQILVFSIFLLTSCVEMLVLDAGIALTTAVINSASKSNTEPIKNYDAVNVKKTKLSYVNNVQVCNMAVNNTGSAWSDKKYNLQYKEEAKNRKLSIAYCKNITGKKEIMKTQNANKISTDIEIIGAGS